MIEVSGYQFIIEKDLVEKGAPFTVDMTYMGFAVTSRLELGGGGSCSSGSCSGGSCSTGG